MKTIGEQAVAEFVGTLALVFVGAGSAIIAIANGGGYVGLIGVALAHGLVLGTFVSNLGHVSGGHFNPAVTIAVWVGGKIETVRAGSYVLAQLAGAVAGAGLLRWVLPEQAWRNGFLGATLVSHGFGITNAKAVLLEAILTFLLVTTVYAVAVDDRGAFRSIAGLPIGLVLVFDILVGGQLTGASMNPARSFGPALVAWKWTDFWVYIVGPVSGGIIAAALYVGAFLRTREVAAPRTETPIGGGPEEDL
ncbi:MAG TPA: MIP/aquaporin family protein [Actinomycetota bacterium]|jgi:aquaporin Z